MLKRENRLSTVLLKNPRVYMSPLFTLKESANNRSFNRFAFVVSKKLDKRATARNLIKRKFRSSIEQIFDKIDQGHDFVFYLKPSSAGVEREKLFEEITKIFSQNQLLK